MKFEKILMIGYDEKTFNQEQWNRIDLMTNQRILLPKDSPEISEHLITTDCILVKLGATIDQNMIDSMPKLKYIGMLGTGYGRIDASYAASKDITVCNIAGYSTESVAEFVFSLILEFIREIERGKIQARGGNYSEDGFRAYEIKGKTFGVIGLGRIGSRTAEIASEGFGADTRYWSRRRKDEYENKGIKYQEVEELLKESDFISIHLEFNKETEHFLNNDLIQKIKPNSVVVNTAPMELIDINALEKRLEIGDISFILDHSDELTESDATRLSKYENCIIYPPIGYISNEATLAKLDMFVDNIENFMEGTPTNKVN
ncbi:MAG: hypothetical protein KAJ51_15270 [Thermoplasmata archaeon]|nr:hypothetical protein [Thermoplasmata archaeon]